jgi:ATP-dependent protease ClpP protease subunit
MTNPTGTGAPPPEEAYGVYVDEINQACAARLVNGITVAMAAGAKRIHMMFQSFGGFVGDGVMLFNFFRSLDGAIELSLYNSGQVSSAAVTAFLGAKHRIASPRSLFMLHRTHNSPQFATASKLEHVSKTLTLDDQRSESIWRERISMPEELWTQLDVRDLFLTGEDAVRYGIATKIGEFAPPAGFQIYKI